MNGPADTPRRLHPATLAIRFLKRLPRLFVALLAIYFATELGLVVTVLLGIASLAFTVIAAWLYWRRFTYQTADAQLAIESGILSRNRRTIPFDRIQDVSLEESLLARIFGVAIVRIETGASGTDEGKLDCVSRAEAERLRDLVRAHRYGGEAASPAAETSDAPLFSMDPARLLIYGLFSFSLVFLAILGGAWQYAGDLLPVDIATPDYWAGEQGQAIIGALTLRALAALATGLVIIGIVTGILRIFLKEFGFRLTRTETGLRRERGLFTRTDVVIPLRRLQAAIVSTGWVRRLFGWHGLALQSLGSDGKAGAHHDAAPFAQPGELVPVFAEIAMPSPPDREVFAHVSRRSITQRYLLGGAALAIVTLAVSVAAPAMVWAPLLAGGLLAPWPWLAWRAHGYALMGGVLFVRSGVTEPRVTILPLAKVQTVSLVQSFVQRLFGLCSIRIGTAGAPRAMPLTILDLDRDTADRLRVRLLAPALAND